MRQASARGSSLDPRLTNRDATRTIPIDVKRSRSNRHFGGPVIDHHKSRDVERLDRLEKRARTYKESARRCGNMARFARAVRLEIATDTKMMAIVMGEVAPFRS